MQKFLRTLTLLACLALPWVAQAQNTLTVADGTTTNTYVPVHGLYVDDFVRSQTIYPASMIEEAADAYGMNGGTISSMTFYLTTPASASWGTANFVVRLTEVSATTLSTWADVTNATTVYEGSLDGTQSTMTVNFTTPYTYNGGNLLLEVYSTATGTWKSATFSGVAATGASWQGHSSSAWTAVSGSAQNFIPKTTFTFTGGTPITCRTVSNLAVSNITANSAVLTWEDNNNTGASYSIYNGDQLLGTVAAGTYTYTATGLTGNTEYTLAVAANCSATDASAAKGVTFRTECDMISSLPYEDGMESVPDGSYQMPFCWAKYNNNTNSYPYSYNYNAHSGSRALYFYFSTYGTYPDAEYAILPQVDVTAYPMNQNMVSFWLRTSNLSYTNVEVGTMSDPTDPTTFTSIATLEAPSATNTYTKYIVKLNAAPATDAYIAIKANKPSGYVTIYVDDLVLDQMPSCWPVTDLAVDTATATSVTLSWNDAENAEGITYSVTYGTETVSNLTSPAVISGLTPNTEYTFNVVANCSASDASNPVSITTRTLCDETLARSLPFVMGFEEGENDLYCWKVQGDGSFGIRTGDYAAATGAHSGTYNVYSGYTSRGAVTKLITPMIDLSTVGSATLSFWHVQRTWGSDQDELRVYYRTAADAEWILIPGAEFTDEISTWTEERFVLPNPTATYQIAFEKTDDYGYGVAIDDIEIAETPRHTIAFNYLTLDAGVMPGTAVASEANPYWGSTVTLTSTPEQDMRTAAWYAGNIASIEGETALAEDEDVFSFVITQDTTFTVVYGYGQFEIKGIFANDNQVRMGTIAGNSPYGNNKYDYGTEATLTATANRGFQFVEWRNEDGSLFSIENPLTLTATQAYTLVGHFDVATYNVTATGEHGTFTGTGTYNYGELASIQAVADEHYHFVKWSDDNTNNPRNYRVIADAAFTAIFEPDVYTVAINGSSVANYTIKDADGNDTVKFAYNTTATVEATVSDEHYTFVKWTAVINGENTDLSTANPYTFAVENDITLVPVFDAQDYTLTIATNDAGMGAVSFVGDEYTGTSVTADYKTVVNVKAETTNNYSQFVNWTANGRDLGNANPIEVSIDSTYTLTANFSFVQYPVYTAVEPAETGSVTFTPQTPAFNDDVTFTATAKEHWVFDHWVDTEGNPDNNAVHTEIMFDTLRVTAYFVRDQHAIAGIVADETHGTVTVTNADNEPTATFVHGDSATVTYIAGYGYSFAGWKNQNGTIVSTDSVFTFEVTEDTTLTATVNPLPYKVFTDVFAEGDGTDPRGDAFVNNSYEETYSYLTAINSQLSFEENYGYVFDFWANEAGDTINLPFTLTQDTTVYAHFKKDVFSVQAKIAADYRMMGRVSGSVAKSEYLDEVDLTATANYGYHFTQWTDAQGNAIVETQDTVVLNGNVLTYTTVMDTIFYAQFDYDTYSVEGATNDANFGNVVVNNQALNPVDLSYSQTVTLNAAAKEHYHFVQWQDGNTENPRSFLLTQDTVFTATFAIDTHTVTLKYAENKVDTIWLTAVTNEKFDTNRFIYGTEVAAEVEAAYGYTFEGWNFNGVNNLDPANPFSFILTQDTTINVNFVTNKYTVTVASNDDTKGTATVNDEADTTVDYLTNVTLVATPEVGYDFVEWRDATEDTLISTSASYTYQVVNTIDIVANFAPHAYVVTIATANETMGDVAWAAPTHIETLTDQKDTVADGASNSSYVPVYGLYMDTYSMKSQMVYSADLLADLPAGAEIKQLTFYLKTPASAAWTGTVQVKLAEMDDDAMSAYVSGTAMADVTSATLVYTGQLDATGTTMSIVFDQPYTYNGGNLLYDLTCTATGNYKSAYFYCVATSTTGISRYRQSSSKAVNKLSVLPKVTFLYDADVVVYDPIEGVTYDATDPDHVAHVEYQKSVAMEATANYGYHFDNWSNNLDATTSTDNPMTVASIEADVTYTANFDKDDFTITVVSNDELQGTVSVEGADNDTVVKYLDTINLVAAPIDENHRLLFWENQAGDRFPTTGVATSDTLQVVVEKNDTYTATFGYQEFVLTANTEDINMGGVYVQDPNASGIVSIAEGFESGLNGWTMNHVHSSTGVTSSYDAYEGSSLFRFYYTTNTPQYLISPEITTANPLEISFKYAAYSSDYEETFQVGYSTTDMNAASFTWQPEVGTNNTDYVEYSTTAPAGTKYVAIRCNSDDQFYLFIDDIHVTSIATGVTPSLPTSNAVVDYGTDIDIIATPAEHYHFVGWKGANGDTVAALGDNATPTITVAGDSTLTALFDGDQMPMTYQVNNAIRGAVDGPATGEFNTQVTFTATANHGYEFAMWEDGDETNPRTVTVAGIDAKNTYKAIFDYTKYNVFVSAEHATVSVTNDMADVHDSIYTDVDTIDALYYYGQTIEMTFTAAEHYHFAENDQKTYVVEVSTLNQPDSVNIVAVIDQHNVTIASNDVTMGEVKVNGVEGNYAETLDFGTELNLAVSPAEHYHFVKWSDNVEAAERTVTLGDEDITLTAIFAINEYTVDVKANAEEGTASWTSGTTTLTINCHDSYGDGWSGNAVNVKQNGETLATITIESGDLNSQDVVVNANAPVEFTWTLGNDNYGNNGYPKECSFEVLDENSVELFAQPQFADNDAVEDGELLFTLPAQTTVLPNTNVTFTATANPGYEFAKWTSAGVDVSTENPYSMPIVKDTTLTANFTFVGFGIQVATNNEVMGKAYINNDETQVTYIAPYEEEVVLHAAPEYGYKFINWTNNRNNSLDTENPLTISATQAITYTANFNFDDFELKVSVAEGQEERGTVNGADVYPYGTQVSISAVANEGYIFLRWNDGVTNAVRTVTVDGTTEYVAYFRTDAVYTVAANAEHGFVTGTGSNFYENDVATLTATPALGYSFVNWTNLAGEELSAENPFAITVVSDTTVVANFDAMPYTVTVTANPEQGTTTGTGSYLFGQEVTISATPLEGYTFDKWDDDVTTNPRTIVVSGNVTYTALFNAIPPTMYYIGASAVNGTVEGAGNYAEGATVTLTATPATACYDFVGWFNGNLLISEDATYSFTATSNTTLLAIFDEVELTGDTIAEECSSFTWHGTDYDASGDYTYTYTSVNGCDSLVTLHLTINTPIAPLPEIAAECSSYEWHGTTYTQSGVYTFPTTDIHGCAVEETLNLTIYTPIVPETEYVSQCGSYIWHDVERTATGIYTYPTTDIHGCAVEETLNLTILNVQTETVTATACDSLIWNGNVYNVSGTYTFETSAVSGCDSIVTLNLTINNSVAGLDTTAVNCGPFTWKGETYVQSGDYEVRLTAANTCDSILTLHLTVNNDQATEVEETACDSLVWNGATYTVSGDYLYETQTIHGCDSTVTLHLTINHSDAVEVETEATGSFEWNGETYTESGDYTWTGTNVYGCDSTVTLHLTINPQTYIVTVSVNNAEMGNVNPAGVNTVLAGATFTATATPNEGYRFVNWSNGSTNATIEVVVNEDMELVANFEAILYTVTVTSDNTTMGYVTGDGQFRAGSTVVVEAHANPGYHFVRWSDNTTNAHYEFTLTQDVTLVAYFEVDTQGIDDVEGSDANIYTVDNTIVVKGAENLDVYVYDVNGRCVRKQANATETLEFTMSNSGVYLVKVGNAPAKRVVVVR